MKTDPSGLVKTSGVLAMSLHDVNSAYYSLDKIQALCCTLC